MTQNASAAEFRVRWVEAATHRGELHEDLQCAFLLALSIRSIRRKTIRVKPLQNEAPLCRPGCGSRGPIRTKGWLRYRMLGKLYPRVVASYISSPGALSYEKEHEQLYEDFARRRNRKTSGRLDRNRRVREAARVGASSSKPPSSSHHRPDDSALRVASRVRKRMLLVHPLRSAGFLSDREGYNLAPRPLQVLLNERAVGAGASMLERPASGASL
jgi:hypothetical protein